jgi:hypothetical protein
LVLSFLQTAQAKPVLGVIKNKFPQAKPVLGVKKN